MSEDSFIVLAVLLVLAFPILAIVSLVMVLGLKGRVRRLEEQFSQMASGRASDTPSEIGAALPVPEPPKPRPKASLEPVNSSAQQMPSEVIRAAAQDLAPPPVAAHRLEGEAAASTANLVPPGSSKVRAVEKRRVSLEERLGTRWAVWVGGVALALGGTFLGRYAIEEDLVGAGVRIVAGLIFSLALVAGGEYLRHRPVVPAGQQSAYIPGVVTAAGTVALFATIYAAYAVYEFLSPAQAFVLLGVVGVVTMYAAALHGPWLAGLGLVGAYGTPLLVSSNAPSPWALALFVLAVTTAAFVLARARLWRWLAVTSTGLALLWGFMLIGIAGQDNGSVIVFILALTALVGAVLIYEPHSGRIYQRFDAIGIGSLAALCLLALGFAGSNGFSHASLAVLLVVMAVALASSLFFDALAPAAVIAGLAGLGCLLIWPIDSQLTAEPATLLPGHLYLPFLMPEALQLYLEMATLPAAALFAATTLSLMRPNAARQRALRPSFALALAGAGAPIFALAVTYLRVEIFRASLPFAAVALGLAIVFTLTTERFLRLEGRQASDPGGSVPSFGAGSSLHAVAACTAVALALTFIIADSPLTLAFGLSALGAAWVSTRRPLPALRWCAAGFVLLVLSRLGGAWMLAGGFPEHLPGWQDVALRYALPALACYRGGLVLRRSKTDLPAVILDFGAILLAAAAAVLAIRLGVRGGDEVTQVDVSLTEAGLYTALAFAVSMLLLYRSSSTTSLVYRSAAPATSILGLCLAVAGPLIIANPQVSWVQIAGGSLINSLLPGYVLPALLAGGAAEFWRRYGERLGNIAGRLPFRALCGMCAFVLGFFFVTLEVRKIFADGVPGFEVTSSAENWGYTIAWLAYGIALLALGIWTRAKPIRLGSAVVIMLAVIKAFLFDMSELEGLWRALSFIGLGATLIGIGLVYQRLLERDAF